MSHQIKAQKILYWFEPPLTVLIPTGNGKFQGLLSEYDLEIPQSQTADYPVAPRGRAAKPSRDTRKTN